MSELTIKKEEVIFDSRDGESKVRALKWIPEQEPICILQIVHGMAEYIDRYDEFATYLAQRGVLVVGDDHLGHGKTVKNNNGKQGYFCEKDAATVLVRDEHRLKKETEKQYPGVPYIIMGHSMGSFIVRNYLCRYGTGVTASIICGTGDQPSVMIAGGKFMCGLVGLFCGKKHVSKFLDNLSFGAYNKRIENPKTAYDWLSVNEENVEKYIADPDCGFCFTVNGFDTLLTLVKRLKNEEYVAQMPKNLPIFLIAGAEDPVGDYGEGVRRVYDLFTRLGMEDLQLKLYKDHRHEILNEKDREAIFEDIYKWIQYVLEKN